MDSQAIAPNDWVRAATLAQMLLSQSLSDEELDELIEPAEAEPVPGAQAA